MIWGWFFSWCLYCQVTSQVKLAAFKSLCSGYTWLPQPRCLSSGQHTTRYPSTALPSTPQKSLLCMCAWICIQYVLLCVRVSTCLCVYGCNCVYISNCVFAGARSSRNHFWWISTLALESCTFSSGWLMGLLTDACTNLLLLPLLLFPTPSMCVCKSLWISVLCIGWLWL